MSGRDSAFHSSSFPPLHRFKAKTPSSLSTEVEGWRRCRQSPNHERGSAHCKTPGYHVFSTGSWLTGPCTRSNVQSKPSCCCCFTNLPRWSSNTVLNQDVFGHAWISIPCTLCAVAIRSGDCHRTQYSIQTHGNP